jgi:hypothetical protein
MFGPAAAKRAFVAPGAPGRHCSGRFGLVCCVPGEGPRSGHLYRFAHRDRAQLQVPDLPSCRPVNSSQEPREKLATSQSR